MRVYLSEALERNYPVWPLLKKAVGVFVLFTLSDYQCERSLPHQSLL